MKIEQRDINSIKPYENNPRNISPAVESVARSIKDYGFRNPIIVDKGGDYYLRAYTVRRRTIPRAVFCPCYRGGGFNRRAGESVQNG